MCVSKSTTELLQSNVRSMSCVCFDIYQELLRSNVRSMSCVCFEIYQELLQSNVRSMSCVCFDIYHRVTAVECQKHVLCVFRNLPQSYCSLIWEACLVCVSISTNSYCSRMSEACLVCVSVSTKSYCSRMSEACLVCVSKSTKSYCSLKPAGRPVCFETYQTRPKSIAVTPPYMAQSESDEQETWRREYSTADLWIILLLLVCVACGHCDELLCRCAIRDYGKALHNALTLLFCCHREPAINS